MFKNLTIKTKLVLLAATTLFGLALSISIISINKSTDVMISYEMNKLSAVGISKHGEIERYFSNLKAIITSMATNRSTQNAFDAFETSFYKLQKDIDLNIENVREELKSDIESNYISNVNYEVPSSAQKRAIIEYLPKDTNALLAQYIFITDNSAPIKKKNSLTYNPKYKSSYMYAHKKHHPYLNSYLQTFNLYDIFFVDIKGNIIYTDSKENDFATNLISGTYKDSGLSRAYKKTLNLNLGEIYFEDFSPYEPSYNEPVSFISTPIFKDGKRKGVLVFQMPVEDINSIMQFEGMQKEAGLGDSGESYLVGSDYMMRSNSRFQKNIDDKIVQNLGTTIGVWKVETKSSQAVFTGQQRKGEWIIEDYRGIRVLSAFDTIDIFDQVQWAMITEIDEEEVLEPGIELKYKLLFTTIIALLIFSLITFYFIHYLIGRPLNDFQDGLLDFFEFLLGTKDSVDTLAIKSNDEIGQMTLSVNNGIDKTRENFKHKEDGLWIRDGVSQLNNLLVDAITVKEVTERSIIFVSEYLNAGVGILYLYDPENEELKEYAGYAHKTDNNLPNCYALGNGIVGQVAKQKSPINLSGVEAKEPLIHTATISHSPTNTYTYPLLYKDNLYGVIEIASFSMFDKKELDFLNASNMIIATSVYTSIQNRKVKELLQETELANMELKTNQEKLEEANVRMEEQQQKLEINNVELEEQQQQLEVINANMEEQQQQLEEANANMEEQQQQLHLSEQNLKVQNNSLEETKKELEVKANELQLSSKYKSEFLANMSHELRTPLNSIILLSQLLEKNKNLNLSDDDVKKANVIFSSGNELLRLINDILDLSKIESGKMELVVDKFDSGEFLDTINNLFEHSAQDKGLELKIIDEYKGTIHSDRDRLSQLIRNLTSNSLKFTKDGSITVRIANSKDIDKPIEISVADTGIGIPKEQQDNIFKAFIQADGSTSRKYGGTGLGLSISKEITRLLRGEISLESEESKGSVFRIKIPNLDADVKIPDVANITQHTKIASAVPKKVEINDDRNILNNDSAIVVIDDDVVYSNIVYENIKKHNHFGLIAHTAEDGLRLIRTYNVSGIILDLTLPDMDGIEVLKELKNDSKLKDIPVHIISSKDRDDSTLQIGAIGYGQKPLLEKDLDSVISKLEEFIKSKTNSNDLPKKEKKIENIDLSQLNVLVVDDDIKNIFVLDSALGEYDAKIQTAYNGKEAIQKLKEDKTIDIVLMDIMMPVMDGYEAIEAIRADSELANIPIIAVTAKAMKEDRDKSISIGADDFISKPINMEALIKLIKVWSDKKSR